MGLILSRFKDEGVQIRHIPIGGTIDVIVKDIHPSKGRVGLEVHGGKCNGYPELAMDQELELAEGLTISINKIASHPKVRMLYQGPKDVYEILRYELLEKGKSN